MARLVELQSDDGCGCFWGGVVESAVIGVEDAPGLELGVGSFDGRADRADLPVVFFVALSVVFLVWEFPDRGDDAGLADESFVPDQTDVGQLQDVRFAQRGDVVGRSREGVGDPDDVAEEVGQDVEVAPGGLVLAGPVLGVVLPRPARCQCSVDEPRRPFGQLVGGGDPVLERASDDPGLFRDDPGHGGLGHPVRGGDVFLGAIAAQVGQDDRDLVEDAEGVVAGAGGSSWC